MKTKVFVQGFDVIEKRICGFKYTSKEYMRIIHTPQGDLIANSLDVMVVDKNGDYMLISPEMLDKHHVEIHTVSLDRIMVTNSY